MEHKYDLNETFEKCQILLTFDWALFDWALHCQELWPWFDGKINWNNWDNFFRTNSFTDFTVSARSKCECWHRSCCCWRPTCESKSTKSTLCSTSGTGPSASSRRGSIRWRSNCCCWPPGKPLNDPIRCLFTSDRWPEMTVSMTATVPSLSKTVPIPIRPVTKIRIPEIHR